MNWFTLKGLDFIDASLVAEAASSSSLFELERSAKLNYLRANVLTTSQAVYISYWENNFYVCIPFYSSKIFLGKKNSDRNYQNQLIKCWQQGKDGTEICGTALEDHFYLSDQIAALERLIDQAEAGTLHYFPAPKKADRNYSYLLNRDTDFNRPFPVLSRSGLGILRSDSNQVSVWAKAEPAAEKIGPLLSLIPQDAAGFSVYSQPGFDDFGSLRAFVRLQDYNLLMARQQTNRSLGARVETYLNVNILQSIADHLGFGGTEVYYYALIGNHLWQARSKAGLRALIRRSVNGGNSVLDRPEISEQLREEMDYFGAYPVDWQKSDELLVVSGSQQNWRATLLQVPPVRPVGWEHDFKSEITFFTVDQFTGNWLLQTSKGDVFYSGVGEEQSLANSDPIIGTPYLGAFNQVMWQTQKEVFNYFHGGLDTLLQEAAAPMLHLDDPIRSGSRHYLPTDEGRLTAYNGQLAPLSDWDSIPYTSRLFSSPVLLGDTLTGTLMCHTAEQGIVGFDRSGQTIFSFAPVDTVWSLAGKLMVQHQDPHRPDFYQPAFGNELAILRFGKEKLLQIDHKGDYQVHHPVPGKAMKDYLLLDLESDGKLECIVLYDDSVRVFGFTGAGKPSHKYSIDLAERGGELFRLEGTRYWGVFYRERGEFQLFDPINGYTDWSDLASYRPFHDPKTGNMLMVRGTILTAISPAKK